MSRVIKFRAWDRKNKLFVYCGLEQGAFFVANRMWDGDDLEPWQELTGLTDKNGKEIYEGDILRIMKRDVDPLPSDDADETLYLAKINFCEGQFEAEDLSTNGSWHRSGWWKHEIIGNVFENPELLHA